MAKSKNRLSQEVNAGSMADIAFLLLIFFLVTTTIASDKGITNLLPPKQDPNQPPPEVDLNKRNIFNILVNANDQLLVEDEYLDNTENLSTQIKEFLLNFGDPTEEAVALYNGLPPSLKALSSAILHPQIIRWQVVRLFPSRPTGVLAMKCIWRYLTKSSRAYFEIYAERVGLTPDQYRALTGKTPAEKELMDRGKEGIPLAISIAEPDKIGGN